MGLLSYLGIGKSDESKNRDQANDQAKAKAWANAKAKAKALALQAKAKALAKKTKQIRVGQERFASARGGKDYSEQQLKSRQRGRRSSNLRGDEEDLAGTEYFNTWLGR